MIISQSPDWYQGAPKGIMERLLHKEVHCFIENVKCCTPTYKEYLRCEI